MITPVLSRAKHLVSEWAAGNTLATDTVRAGSPRLYRLMASIGADWALEAAINRNWRYTRRGAYRLPAVAAYAPATSFSVRCDGAGSWCRYSREKVPVPRASERNAVA